MITHAQIWAVHVMTDVKWNREILDERNFQALSLHFTKRNRHTITCRHQPHLCFFCTAYRWKTPPRQVPTWPVPPAGGEPCDLSLPTSVSSPRARRHSLSERPPQTHGGRCPHLPLPSCTRSHLHLGHWSWRLKGPLVGKGMKKETGLGVIGRAKENGNRKTETKKVLQWRDKRNNEEIIAWGTQDIETDPQYGASNTTCFWKGFLHYVSTASTWEKTEQAGSVNPKQRPHSYMLSWGCLREITSDVHLMFLQSSVNHPAAGGWFLHTLPGSSSKIY